MSVPMYAIHNLIKSNGILNKFMLRAIDKYSDREVVIKANAFRILENLAVGRDLEEIDGLKKGMEILGCKDPEELIHKIEPEFEREILAPVTGEREF